MKKILVFLMFLFVLNFVVASDIGDFVYDMGTSPDDYRIVVSNSLSPGERIAAKEFSSASGISVIFDTTVSGDENLLVIGDKERNVKTSRLGNAIEEDTYVRNGNMFLIGDVEENVESLRVLTLYFTLGQDAPAPRVSDDPELDERSSNPEEYGKIIAVDNNLVRRELFPPRDNAEGALEGSGRTFLLYLLIGVVLVLVVIIWLVYPRKAARARKPSKYLK